MLGVGLMLAGLGCGDSADVSFPPAAPRIVSPANGDITNDATPRVRGEADEDLRVELLDEDGNVLGTSEATGGDWAITSSELADGSHELTAVAIEGDHNRSRPSSPITITIDTVAPDAPEITDPEDDALLNDSRPDIAGRAEADGRVEILLAGEVVGEGDVDEDGRFEVRAALPDNGRFELNAAAEYPREHFRL